MDSKTLQISELDFDNIKYNLKSFMRSQEEFLDFDFEGSAINVLLDVLAYNTHYMAVHANMSISETFLQSSTIRNAAVMRAKELNYFPRQYSSATAILGLSIEPDDSPALIEVPKGTKFLTSPGFFFINTESVFLYNDGTGVYSGEIVIHEGSTTQEQFQYSTDNRVYELLNTRVDTDFMKVLVGNEEYLFGNDKQLTDKYQKFYYLSEESDRKVGLFFGDDFLSAEPANGKTITVEYLITSGREANGIRDFQLPTTISGYQGSSFETTLISSSNAGSYGNTINQIKMAASKYWQAQGRAVTADDYSSIIYNKVPNVDSVSVWEEHTRAGSIFISIKPDVGEILTPYTKEGIIDMLKDFAITGTTPILVDPEYLRIDVLVNVNYDPELAISADNIASNVLNTVNTHFLELNNTFGADMLYSAFLTDIDNSSIAIINSNAVFVLNRQMILMESNGHISSSFLNAIIPGTFTSNIWDIEGADYYYISDDGDGKIFQYKNTVLFAEVGTIDYVTGDLSLNIAGYQDYLEITISADALEDDIYADKNYIIALNTLKVNPNGV